MKKEIQPKYNTWVQVNCICGNDFEVNSVANWPIKVESCPACHPTYTGKQETKVVKWRMEKFLEKQKKIDQVKKNKDK